MSEADSQRTKIVNFIDDPSAVRGKNSANGLEVEHRLFDGVDTDIYNYWGLNSWNTADTTGASAVLFTCHSRLSNSIDSILRIIRRSANVRVAIRLSCECSREHVRTLESSGCAIMPARSAGRHLSRVMKEQLIEDWMKGLPVSLPMAPGDPLILNARPTNVAAAPLHDAISHAHSVPEHEDLLLAVVSPERSGSMALADFLSLSVPARFSVFHEHDWTVRRLPSGGLTLKGFRDGKSPGHPSLMKFRMTEAFITEPSPFRYVFSLHRNPIERFHSYFTKSFKALFTADQFDIETVRQEFEAWLDRKVNSYLRWLDVHWPAVVGFRQSEMDVITPGIRHRRGTNQSVTVMDISHLAPITQSLLNQYGRGRYPALKRNSASELGIDEHYSAFKEACPIPEHLAQRLLDHPEAQALAQGAELGASVHALGVVHEYPSPTCR